MQRRLYYTIIKSTPLSGILSKTMLCKRCISKFTNVIEQDNQLISIKGYNEYSFQVNDVLVNQSVILLPKSFLLWNAKKFQDITIESLSIFPLIFPTIEIIFVGCGHRMIQPLPNEVTKYFRSKGIVLELSDSVNAASSFNMLNSEGRNVAAALLTQEPIEDIKT